MLLYSFSFCLLVGWFGCTHGVCKFPGQGLNLSCSWDLCHSCGNARSLTHCAGRGIEPVIHQPPKPLQRQCRILNPLCHSGNSYSIVYWIEIIITRCMTRVGHQWWVECYGNWEGARSACVGNMLSWRGWSVPAADSQIELLPLGHSIRVWPQAKQWPFRCLFCHGRIQMKLTLMTSMQPEPRLGLEPICWDLNTAKARLGLESMVF